ncbi:hypothetical protein FO519_007724 [Halicephalobus sp. NKZ332]|nr:hypothetical protein FO519_007724 [Halicephalobus sp. NKZ332]
MFGLKKEPSPTALENGRRNTVFNSLHAALLPVAEGLVSNLHRRRCATVPKDDVENPPVQIYRPKSLSSICEVTKFSKREVQIIYRSFKQEFVTGLSIITRGSIDEKIDWIFRLYDVNKRGIIGQPELLMVTQSIYELLGKNVEPPINRRCIVDHVLDVHKVA